jgi:hypothetical protein
MTATRYSVITFATLSIILLSSTAHAQMRTWTDSRGHTIEAELVENMNGEVTLQKADGDEAHISISDLAAKDQKYVLANSPPKISISVSEVTDRKNKGFTVEAEHSEDNEDMQIQTSSSYYKVTLKKSGTIPYSKPIQAELYIIGYKKQSDEFVLLSKTIKKFTYDSGDVKDEYAFASETTTTKNLQGNKESGTVYHGNLVVLVDEKGHVFEAKGSRSKMLEHTAFIRKLDAGATATKTDLISAQNAVQ